MGFTGIITWIPVAAGVWTRIFQGPSSHLVGAQLLEFTTSTADDLDYVLTFTLRRYSAAAPFYYSLSGSATAKSWHSYAAGNGATWIPAIMFSPWTEVSILTSRSCRSHLLE